MSGSSNEIQFGPETDLDLDLDFAFVGLEVRGLTGPIRSKAWNCAQTHFYCFFHYGNFVGCNFCGFHPPL